MRPFCNWFIGGCLQIFALCRSCTFRTGRRTGQKRFLRKDFHSQFCFKCQKWHSLQVFFCAAFDLKNFFHPNRFFYAMTSKLSKKNCRRLYIEVIKLFCPCPKKSVIVCIYRDGFDDLIEVIDFWYFFFTFSPPHETTIHRSYTFLYLQCFEYREVISFINNIF